MNFINPKIKEFAEDFAIEQAPSCDWDWLQLTVVSTVGDKYCGDGAGNFITT
jgi:hypothetical protein